MHTWMGQGVGCGGEDYIQPLPIHEFKGVNTHTFSFCLFQVANMEAL